MPAVHRMQRSPTLVFPQRSPSRPVDFSSISEIGSINYQSTKISKLIRDSGFSPANSRSLLLIRDVMGDLRLLLQNKHPLLEGGREGNLPGTGRIASYCVDCLLLARSGVEKECPVDHPRFKTSQFG